MVKGRVPNSEFRSSWALRLRSGQAKRRRREVEGHCRFGLSRPSMAFEALGSCRRLRSPRELLRSTRKAIWNWCATRN